MFINERDKTNLTNVVNNTKSSQNDVKTPLNFNIEDLATLNETDVAKIKELNLNWDLINFSTDGIWKQTNLDDYNLLDKYLPYKKLKTGEFSTNRKVGKNNKKITLNELELTTIQKIYLSEIELFNKYFYFNTED